MLIWFVVPYKFLSFLYSSLKNASFDDFIKSVAHSGLFEYFDIVPNHKHMKFHHLCLLQYLAAVFYDFIDEIILLVGYLTGIILSFIAILNGLDV